MKKFVTILLMWLGAIVIPYSIGQTLLDRGFLMPPGLAVSLLMGYCFIAILWVCLQPRHGEFWNAPRTFWFAVIVHFIGVGFASFKPEYAPGGLIGIIVGHQLCKWTVYFYREGKESPA